MASKYAAPLVASTLVGFYAPWDGRAKSSLATHENSLAVFAPQWLAVRPGAELQVTDDPAAAGLPAKDKAAPAVMPLVSNAHDDIWDTRAADDVILNPVVRAKFLERLASVASERKFDDLSYPEEIQVHQGDRLAGVFAALTRSNGADRNNP